MNAMISHRLGTTRALRSSGANYPQVKRTLRARLVHEFGEQIPVALIRRAMADAENSAEDTGYPQLFFPELAEEKVRQMAQFAEPNFLRGTVRSATRVAA